MLLRTHLAISFAIAFYFVNFVSHEFWFISVVLLSGILPDFLHRFFSINNISDKFQIKEPQGGIFHTYTFCVLVSIIMLFIHPFAAVLALPFFIGYSFHLLADSFTKRGIRPFWPIKTVSSGMVDSGGKVETSIFFVFVVLSIIFFLGYVLS